ncbi:MAG: ATP-binding cassette domain-containing protein [Eggerthellaceae bacterium]|nr:ATP-binding cassette domain-containing protein [Eggerthellaceae bacterium]
MIELQNICKTFRTGKTELAAVRDVSLTIQDGEIFGIIGFSGAGKSTLVRCINLLERPTSGRVIIDGVDLTQLSNKRLRQERKKIGMIFQQFNLLSQSTVAANVRYPLEISGTPKEQADARVKELLELVDLSDKANAFPAQLSGGQKQRVAIARALASNPKIILCDEATSALDPITTRSILDLLKRLNRDLGVTVVVITHEMRVVEQICDRVAVMSEGEVKEEGTVFDVFLQPKSETAKRLIEPSQGEAAGELPEGVIRLAFTGEESGAPVISDMTVKCNVMVSILAANTERIGDKTLGQMLIQLPDDADAQRRVKEYLTGRGVFFEESKPANAAGTNAGTDSAQPVNEAVENPRGEDVIHKTVEEDIPNAEEIGIGKEMD